MMYQQLFRAQGAWAFIVAMVLMYSTAVAAPKPDQILDAKPHELGQKPKTGNADRPSLDIPFNTSGAGGEAALQITHRDVMLPVFVLVNGQEVGHIGRSYKGTGKSFVPVPAGLLKDGPNTVSFRGEVFVNRNFTIEKVALFKKPLRELLKLRPVSVTVTDEDSNQPVPARVSIVDSFGDGAEIYFLSATNTALRKGMLYTSGKRLTFEIPEGRYQFYATRGMEWSLGRQSLSLSGSAPAQVDLRIRRQVDTKGFVAADTHIHTITFSGHGDATVDERMLTLAGEGVELAIATDHNHFTDYRPYQTKLELNSYFTPVVGDEMTTKNGHLNAFPMPLGGPVPDHRESDWVKLVADARVKGAKVVILNHPRFPDPESNPLIQFNFNRASGDRFRGPAFTFNAMEVANSSSPSSMARTELSADPLKLFADWFPVLNYGEKIIAVGSSDSHTVSNPVGQGRTYIRSSTDDAARLNVDELVGNFIAGNTAVGYGIFSEATVNGAQHMGEVARPVNGQITVDLRIASADWIKPRRAVVFLNGLPVAEKKLKPKPGKPFAEQVKFSLKAPASDAYLVCAVFGDGVAEPYWPTLASFTAAIANPIYLDNDGDGKFQFPRETARKMLAATDGSLKAVWALIEKSDDVFAGQLLGLLYRERDSEFVKQLNARVQSAAPNRALYRTFLEHSPLIVVDAKALKAPGKKKSGE